jgi:hypothetical protein
MDDLGITGALAALLKDAIEPTLLQTIEGITLENSTVLLVRMLDLFLLLFLNIHILKVHLHLYMQDLLLILLMVLHQ